MLQIMRALGEGRLSSHDRDAAVSAILRAIGLSTRQAKSVLAHLSALPMARCLLGHGHRNLSAQVRLAARPDQVP